MKMLELTHDDARGKTKGLNSALMSEKLFEDDDVYFAKME